MTRTVAIDEMTGVQAREKIAPPLPMQPGKVERQEFEYRRPVGCADIPPGDRAKPDGTQTLIAGFDVATGRVQGTVGDRRTEADFARFLELWSMLVYGVRRRLAPRLLERARHRGSVRPRSPGRAAPSRPTGASFARPTWRA